MSVFEGKNKKNLKKTEISGEFIAKCIQIFGKIPQNISTAKNAKTLVFTGLSEVLVEICCLL